MLENTKQYSKKYLETQDKIISQIYFLNALMLIDDRAMCCN